MMLFCLAVMGCCQRMLYCEGGPLWIPEVQHTVRVAYVTSHLCAVGVVVVLVVVVVTPIITVVYCILHRK